jgi:hypothetical protein
MLLHLSRGGRVTWGSTISREREGPLSKSQSGHTKEQPCTNAEQLTHVSHLSRSWPMFSPRGNYTRPQWASILQTGRSIERSKLALRDFLEDGLLRNTTSIRPHALCPKYGFGNYDPPQIKLAQKWCWLQWNAATECNNIMLPLAAFPKNY